MIDRKEPPKVCYTVNLDSRFITLSDIEGDRDPFEEAVRSALPVSLPLPSSVKEDSPEAVEAFVD